VLVQENNLLSETPSTLSNMPVFDPMQSPETPVGESEPLGQHDQVSAMMKVVFL
tara:strand:- start:278 stop:439 length:162 start_codon:yes stop_codon:yes gene_type:complete